MKIYLIDCDFSVHTFLQKKLENILLEFKKKEVEIQSIFNFKEFYTSLEEKEYSEDIFIIDINLHEEFTGIDLAEEIRKHSTCANIIFFTDRQEQAIDILNRPIFPQGYIIKNRNLEKNSLEIKKLIKWLLITRGNRYHTLKIELSNKMLFLPFKEIVYVKTIKASRKNLFIHTCNQDFEMTGLLREYKEMLHHQQFYKEFKTCIINLRQIKKIDMQEEVVEFIDGSYLFLGKKSLLKLKRYLN